MRGETTSPGVTWWEFALRLVIVLCLLVAADIAVRAYAGADDGSFDGAYRLPADGSLEPLPAFIRHIRQVREQHPDEVIVAFLGASPAYGIGIRDDANTFSAAFESAATSASVGTKDGVGPSPSAVKSRIRSYNLAANGLLLGDQYVIAKALADSVDLFVVQLTYQTFDPRRSAARTREPDLPTMLHVGINAAEARDLGIEARTDTALDRTIDEAFRTRWAALAHKQDLADALGLKEAPDELYALAAGREDADDATESEATGPGAEDPPADDPTVPFDELDPALQMVAIARAGESSSFALRRDNGELLTLRRLARLLRAQDKPAVFFLAPMNEDVLAAYEVLDEARYERNVARMREAVEDSGHRLLDYHDEPFLTSADFTDLTHTTDSGGVATGRRLYHDLRADLENIERR